LKKIHSLGFTAKQEFIFWEVHWTFPFFNCCLFELGISGRAMMQWATLFLEGLCGRHTYWLNSKGR
jgi:hypothetical protein